MSALLRPVSAAEVRLLRGSLLRPGEPPASLVYHGDDAADTLHAGAFDNGELVGIASVCQEALPADLAALERTGCWRLRGMATVPRVRGMGYGRSLLEACFAHVTGRGGTLIWCNARVVALDFYRHLGFQTHGEEFEIPPIGPHYVMTRRLDR
jgi:GNAT superfamily N-acetyltransferase